MLHQTDSPLNRHCGPAFERPAGPRFYFFFPIFALVLLLLGTAPSVHAGVNNPDISVIAQPYVELSDDRGGEEGNPDRNRPRLHAGELEVVLEAYLNPYARGSVTLAFADEEVGMEEGYFDLVRGLPAGLALRGGRYRAGFGKLNAAHPHTYPFARTFRTLSSYLPGEEGLIENGLSLSKRIALPADAALTASVDWLQGDSFRIEPENEEEGGTAKHGGTAAGDGSRPAVLGRLSGFAMTGEQSGIEVGLSAVHGTNDATEKLRTTILGADLKAKLWNSPRSYLVVQGEALRMERDQPVEHEHEEAYRFAAGERADGEPEVAEEHHETVKPVGFYLFADYNWARRYNVGASFERYQQATSEKTWDAAYGLFAGFSLMEETTSFRFGWERFMPGRPDHLDEDPDAIHTFTVRMIFSMGPHKAHQF